MAWSPQTVKTQGIPPAVLPPMILTYRVSPGAYFGYHQNQLLDEFLIEIHAMGQDHEFYRCL